MHIQAYNWVRASYVSDVLPTLGRAPSQVLDLGGRDINGSVRSIFPMRCDYRVLDIVDGPGVDIVADAADWRPDREYDVVVCCETFEHTQRWPEICLTAYQALIPGGFFIATMAGPGRPQHSGIDGGWTLHPGEWYENIDPFILDKVLNEIGFESVEVDVRYQPPDVRSAARRPNARRTLSSKLNIQAEAQVVCVNDPCTIIDCPVHHGKG